MMVTLMWVAEICWVCTVTPGGSSRVAVCRPCCITVGIKGVGAAVTWAVAVSVPVAVWFWADDAVCNSRAVMINVPLIFLMHCYCSTVMGFVNLRAKSRFCCPFS